MRDIEERSNRRKKMWTMFVVNVLAVVCWLHFRNKYEKTEQTEPGQNKATAAIDTGFVKVNKESEQQKSEPEGEAFM